MQDVKEELIPYIVSDTRKLDFLKYSLSPTFYELDYERMKKAVAIGSRYVLIANNKKLKLDIFNDEKYIYYFNIIGEVYFGITKVKKIKINMEDI